MNFHDAEYTLKAVAAWQETSRENFKRHQSLTPVAMVFSTRHPETGAELPEPLVSIVIPEHLNDIDEQLKFGLAIREVVEKTHALGLFGMFEGWCVLMNGTPADLAPWFGQLNAHPDRIEIVQAFLCHPKIGAKSWRSFIIRDENGKGTMTPYTETPPGQTVIFHGLSDVFNPSTYAAAARSQ